ncbi:YqiA/YcfP family alpha/beta fold hydrolase [Thiolinea disciformis]|uniref:YqiA/YcfP family alpha/beta fold hydrolase n=1 Tax=Thiolinea disciformis TaxID=125614 RepID=UPI00037B8691|nr:YqiA/YcfP family alpha/beta fold hydrolase [Thiolinea disciformis]
MSLIYIHGFNSSSLSAKAQETKRWLEARRRGNEWLCPDLPHRPAQAVQVLETLIQSLPEKPKLIGSSLGGFYATILVARFNIKAVLINPAVHPALVLRPALGRQKSWHGESYYDFTQAHLDELNALDLIAPLCPENILLMQETGDEVLNWRDAVAYYRDCHQLIFRGGDHGFTRFRNVLDLIDKF